ncbi:MAG: hypothetical protein AVDCRST_MAG48-1355, partial [uncultured Friedmanniella sp.]
MRTVEDVASRACLVALPGALAAVLGPAVTDPSTALLLAATTVLLTTALLGAVAVVGSTVPAPALGLVRVAAPGTRARRGHRLQQTRPGVTGRTRSRAPGCGRWTPVLRPPRPARCPTHLDVCSSSDSALMRLLHDLLGLVVDSTCGAAWAGAVVLLVVVARLLLRPAWHQIEAGRRAARGRAATAGRG